MKGIFNKISDFSAKALVYLILGISVGMIIAFWVLAVALALQGDR